MTGACDLEALGTEVGHEDGGHGALKRGFIPRQARQSFRNSGAERSGRKRCRVRMEVVRLIAQARAATPCP